jgi:hypothetical protein
MEGARGWLDVLDGDEEIGVAVQKVAKDGVSSEEGEDFDAMRERVGKL